MFKINEIKPQINRLKTKIFFNFKFSPFKKINKIFLKYNKVLKLKINSLFLKKLKKSIEYNEKKIH